MPHDVPHAPPDHGPPFQELRRQVNFFVGLAQCVSQPLELWTRKPGTAGERYFGFHAGIGVLLMLLVPPFLAPQENLEPVLWLWCGTLVLQLLHRLVGAWKRRHGYLVHSLYSGDSHIPGDPVEVKARLEPCFIVVCGGLTCLGSVAVGGYLVLAGLCLGLVHAWQEDADHAQDRATLDALFEQQHRMARLESRRDATE